MLSTPLHVTASRHDNNFAFCAVGAVDAAARALETWSEAMYAAYRGRQLLLFGLVHREAAAFRCWRERYGEGGSRRNKYWGRVAVRDIMWA